MDSSDKLDYLTLNSSVLHSFEGSAYSSSPRSLHISASRPKGRIGVPLNFAEIPIKPGVLRVVFRLQYKKVRRLMRVCTENMDLRLLSRLAPSAALLITDRTVTLGVMLRLDGRCWPPLIVYDAAVVGAKKLGLRRDNTMRLRKLWRMVISDKPMLGTKTQLPVLKPTSFTSPRSVHLTSKPYRRDASLTYRWRNREQREDDERPEVKYRYLETSIVLKPVRVRKQRPCPPHAEYVAYWSNLCTARLSWKSGLPSNSFLL